MKKRHLCTTFKLNKNSFCLQKAKLEVLIKVTSKADRWKESGKSFTKNWFLFVFFSRTKNVFHYMLAKFFYVIQTNAISSLRSQILRCTGTSCLSNIGIRSKLRDVLWLFWVYLYQTMQYQVFQELRIHLGKFLYLWSLHLVVIIVKTMFKWIFFSLIFTPYCKYTHSKNKVKFLQLTFSELH